MTATTQRCDRVREWASRALDGELSQFEQALLAAHVRQCGACRSFQEQIIVLTEELRAAPLEPLERRIAVQPPRRRLILRPLQASAAALAVVAVGLGSLFASVQSQDALGPRSAFAPGVPIGNASQGRELAYLLRSESLEQRAHWTLKRPKVRPAKGGKIRPL